MSKIWKWDFDWINLNLQKQNTLFMVELRATTFLDFFQTIDLSFFYVTRTRWWTIANCKILFSAVRFWRLKVPFCSDWTPWQVSFGFILIRSKILISCFSSLSKRLKHYFYANLRYCDLNRFRVVLRNHIFTHLT